MKLNSTVLNALELRKEIVMHCKLFECMWNLRILSSLVARNDRILHTNVGKYNNNIGYSIFIQTCKLIRQRNSLVKQEASSKMPHSYTSTLPREQVARSFHWGANLPVTQVYLRNCNTYYTESSHLSSKYNKNQHLGISSRTGRRLSTVMHCLPIFYDETSNLNSANNVTQQTMNNFPIFRNLYNSRLVV